MAATAAASYITNMYDPNFNLRLLNSLIKKLPNDKHPSRNSLDLSTLVSTIKTRNLLSQSDDDADCDYKSAIDSWINRLLKLVSSDKRDKCWAGITLLGVTCQECSLERFKASYSEWFDKLLCHLQPLADSNAVKVASCISIADLLTRLGELPNVKKDGTTRATKLMQPILKMLNDDTSNAVLEGAIVLLCTIINNFHSSVQRHYESVEIAIASKLMSPRCSDTMLEKLGYCLAILPKSGGDEDSWSLMMQKIIVSMNDLLNDVFQGFEKDTKTNEAMRALFPPGKDPPRLGGKTMVPTEQTIKIPEESLTRTISVLMRCCCTMITSPFPVMVTIPIQPLLMLAWRVLKVDGSLPHASYHFVTTKQQEAVCSELGTLHFWSLELINVIIMEVRSQLLPHAVKLVRSLVDYFGSCAMAELRIKVYATIRMLLMSMGVGMTYYLTDEVINKASIDLNGYHGSEEYSNYHTLASSVSVPKPMEKKRKREKTSVSLAEPPNKVSRENPAPLSVKIAALETLETLLSVGGAFKSQKGRSNIDHLLMTVVSDACKEGWAREKNNVFHPSDPSPSWDDFQLAALRALLASLTSPSRVRPPYLSYALELFSRGRRELGTKQAEFCRHALMTLEVLIHPRALPLDDYPSATGHSFERVKNRFQENIFSGTPKLNSFPSNTLSVPNDQESEDDDLYESWQKIGDKSEIPVTQPGQTTSNPEKITLTNAQNHFPSENPLDPIIQVEETTSNPKRITSAVAQNSPEKSLGPNIQVNKTTPPKAPSFSAMVESSNVISDAMDAEMTTKKDVGSTSSAQKSSEKDASVTKVGGKTYVTVASTSGTDKTFVFAVDDDSAMDDFPDIVDVEPESDSDEESS